MDPRRIPQPDYGRIRGGDGGGHAPLPSSSGRAIPPSAVPSLSTGQGFYTVESLQGATMVPPPQPAPPPPRFMPRLEPHARDLPPPHLHPAQRPHFGPFARRYPPPPAVGRKMMIIPPLHMPMARHGGPGVLYPRAPPHPPFMGNPRMPGFHPGRFDFHNGWGPGNFERRGFHRNRDRVGASQRTTTKKQGQRSGKPVSESKDKKSLADNQNAGEGGPGWCALCKTDFSNSDSLKMHIAGKKHKKQVESQMQVDEASDKRVEIKEGAEPIATIPEQSKDNEANAEKASEGIVEADDQALETVTVDIAKGEHNCQGLDGKSVTSRKRVLKDTANPNKRPCTAAALSDATNALAATTAKGIEDIITGNEIQKTFDLEVTEETSVDTHAKAADNSSQNSLSDLTLKVDGDEVPTSEKNKISEGAQECVAVTIEVKNASSLESRSAGQSAEIQ